MIRLIALSLLLVPVSAGAASYAAPGAYNSLRLSAGGMYSLVPMPVSGPVALKAAGKEEIGVKLFEASGRFLGLPYVLGPLGEGPQGEFDRGPLVSYSGLDCTTFVEQTMAYALGANEAGAMEILRRIRYKDGVISYVSRNHFPETDWLPNNIAAGFIRDITVQVGGRRAGVVRKVISKRAWYAAKTEADLDGFDWETPAERLARVERLRALGENLPDEDAVIRYVPLSVLPSVINSIPSGTVVSLVREARPDKPLVVTHQFMIFGGPNGKFIRHAAQGQQVMDVPALDYVNTLSAITSWKVLGFNLSEVIK